MNIESLFGVQGSLLTIDILKQFISTQPEENLHLEFKSGAFFDASNKDKITAAVVSFANSDGGVLMIGAKEKKLNGKTCRIHRRGSGRPEAYEGSTEEYLNKLDFPR